jgi:hypothetical protein
VGRLIFTFTSLAYCVDAPWGRGLPQEGFHRMAGIAHQRGIPVTWLVNAKSAEAFKRDLDDFHARYGDDLGLMWGASTATPGATEGAVADLERVRRLFPWSKVSIVGSGQRSNEMVHQLGELGVEGLWGSCWEQIEIDEITDRGAPWGTYYISMQNFKAPAAAPTPLVSFEWTARDLCKSLHSGNPTIFSSDPNDVARAGLVQGRAIAYWQAMFDQYHRNLAHNDLVFFSMHQEAHEMEHSEVCHSYTLQEIADAAEMMDAFFEYVQSRPDVEVMTLAGAADAYRRQNPQGTAPAYMLCDDIATGPMAYWYTKGTPVGPWPRTFLYYDDACQLAFIEGKFEPILLRNYRGATDPDDPYYFAERDIPRVRLPYGAEMVESGELEFAVRSRRPVPFGVALWYDFSTWSVREVQGAAHWKVIEDKLLFARLDAPAGATSLRVRLARR